MSRKRVPTTTTLPFHITARAHNREHFPIDLDHVWQIMCDYLFFCSSFYELKVHCFVLMPNHFHLIASHSGGRVSEALNYFLRETSRELNSAAQKINQNFGGRNHKSILSSYHYFMNAYKYVYQNPVRAKICERVEEYPYSTLHGICGQAPLVIPIAEDTLLFDPNFNQQTLNWLNTKPSEDHEEEMRRALKRPVFEFRTPPRKGRRSLLESELL